MRLVDAEALRKNMEFICMGIMAGTESYNAPLTEIDNAPTLATNLQQRKGMWIEGSNGNIKCDQCGCEIRYSYIIGNKPDFPRFCCDCGAKMIGKEE